MEGDKMSSVRAEIHVDIDILVTVRGEVQPIEVATERGVRVTLRAPAAHPVISPELEGRPVVLPANSQVIEIDAETQGELQEGVNFGLPTSPSIPFMRELLADAIRVFCDYLKLLRAILQLRSFVAYSVEDLSRHPLVKSYTVRWYCDGKELPQGGATMGLTSRPLNVDQWADIGKKLEAGVEPPVHVELLLDAEFYLSVHDLKRAVLFWCHII